ncbi:hypothetical protein N656DRAFT_776527 [Canariomyces notabilis]|uniref:Uncharacterized protein n=1 Tax=Canariomyces notabilis TaxID=2074819 RepID=A0AAN6YWE2_9PEZI|nr:hypothetical protein N656DRAFT_776527 [Canariomyces arenarius]
MLSAQCQPRQYTRPVRRMDPGINPAERFRDGEEETAHRETMVSAEAPVPHWPLGSVW